MDNFDPSTFQNLYEQMQNNQNFLEQMQGIMAMQNQMTSTESDESTCFQLQRTQSNISKQSRQEELFINKQFQHSDHDESFQSIQSLVIEDQSPKDIQNSLEQNQYLVDPSINSLFQDQFHEENSQLDLNNDDQEISEPQGLPTIDPSIITPEYMQMFTQFYQMFITLQNSIQGDQQMNFNDPNFLQSMMFTYFTTMLQQKNERMQSTQNAQISNSNPQLAAIPEIKDSIIEDNSLFLQTSTHNKLCQQLGLNNEIDPSCNCCVSCQQQKQMSGQQQFFCDNTGQKDSNLQNSHKDHDNQVNAHDGFTSKVNQLMNNPSMLGAETPTPITFDIQDAQQNFKIASLLKNENLNNFLQCSQPVHNQDANSQNMYQAQFSLNHLQQDIQSPHNHDYSQPTIQLRNMNTLSPDISPRQNREEILSPKQIHENKLIEYMIDNNDFSNYKARREVIKGKRMSRSICKSNSKCSNIQATYQQQQSINYYNTYQDNSYNQSIVQQYGNLNEKQQQFFSEVKINNHEESQSSDNELKVDMNLYKETRMFFSPQHQSKQHYQQYKDIFKIQENLVQTITENDQKKSKSKGMRRKRTQEKIHEIRRLNEIQRGGIEIIRKGQNGNNYSKGKQQQNRVFEIKELKKSKERKNTNHARKRSCNLKANKENQRLIQSNLHHLQEMSCENILQGQNQDLSISLEENPNYYSKRESDTFRSLNSLAQPQQYLNSDLKDQASLGITNLLINLETTKGICNTFASNNSSQNQLRIKSKTLDINNIIIQDHLEGKKPGQEIHIIKKPVQTEEFKKIQEKLSKYYKSKKQEEDALYKIKQNIHYAGQSQSQQCLQNSSDTSTDMMSMTKTLSSFKSLMMKTMSQISVQDANNIQQSEDCKSKCKNDRDKKQGKCMHENQSINISSIHDDISCTGEISENLTKLINPTNLYNGYLSNIECRNPQQEKQQQSQSQIENEYFKNLKQNKKDQGQRNTIYYKIQNVSGEQNAFSAMQKRRQLSICNCKKPSNCSCDKYYKKDLLSQFQNFLQDMDAQKLSNLGKLPKDERSIYASPIGHNTTNQDFLLTNFQLLGLRRSSSQGSQFSRKQMDHRRESSEAEPQVFNLQHCQSAIAFQHKAMLDNVRNQVNKNKAKDDEDCLESLSTLTMTNGTRDCMLEKQDTNKEEEIRLLNIEKDFMHKGFIEKSHKLNLEENQREELIQRIQRHRLGQIGSQNSTMGSQQEEISQYGQQKIIQNSSRQTIGSQIQTSKQQSQQKMQMKYDTVISLEERMKIQKQRERNEAFRNNL